MFVRLIFVEKKKHDEFFHRIVGWGGTEEEEETEEKEEEEGYSKGTETRRKPAPNIHTANIVVVKCILFSIQLNDVPVINSD